MELITRLPEVPRAIMEWDDRLIIQFGDGFATLLDGIINYDVRGDINCSVMGPRGCMHWTEAEQIFCIDLKNGGCAQDVTANFSGHPSGRKSVQCRNQERQQRKAFNRWRNLFTRTSTYDQ